PPPLPLTHPSTTELSTPSLHDALPISIGPTSPAIPPAGFDTLHLYPSDRIRTFGTPKLGSTRCFRWTRTRSGPPLGSPNDRHAERRQHQVDVRGGDSGHLRPHGNRVGSRH